MHDCSESFGEHKHQQVQFVCNTASLSPLFQIQISCKILWLNRCLLERVWKFKLEIKKLLRNVYCYYLQKYIIKVSIIFHKFQYVFNHYCANAKPAIGRKTTQCHDIQASLIINIVNTTTYSSYNNVIIICQFGKFSRVLKCTINLY